MTRLEQIDYIRDVMIENNPEIVELKFEKGKFPRGRWKCKCGSTNGHQFGNCQSCESKREIIGRPIRLADVLQELWLGEFANDQMLKAEQEKCHEICIVWNLRDDNLDNQSKKCISFIYNAIK